jgi:phage-related protein
MKWEFVYYSSRVKRDILSFPKELLAEFYAMQQIMEEKGPSLGMPYTRAMGDGLFEMRLSDKDGIARVFYCTIEKYEIFVLHSFVKKTRTTPDRELQLARKRLKEVKQHG